jgi:hypothetical protein
MVFVLTVDQQNSRRNPDLVEAALARLRSLPTVRRFERTVGDEFQGVLDDEVSVLDAILDLVRDGHWSIGAGIGAVELPLPPSTRAGRGPAFIRARTAVEAAKRHPQHVAVRGDDEPAAQDVAGPLGLLCAVIADRTPAAWEAIDLARAGLSQAEVAAKLGITRQAVGQRLAAAHWREELQVRPTLVRLLARADARDCESSGALVRSPR